MQTALQDQTSLEARTLGVLQARGMLHLVEGPLQIAEGIDIRPRQVRRRGIRLCASSRRAKRSTSSVICSIMPSRSSIPIGWWAGPTPQPCGDAEVG